MPGYAVIQASELVSALERQIAPFRPPYLLDRRVEGLSDKAGAFRLNTDQTDVVDAKALIVAAGAGAFGPNRPPLADLPAYEASGAVRYSVRRREDLGGRHVVIAGGGDSAVDWALALRADARGAVVHRRAKFRAAPESVAQLEAAAARGEIELVISYQLSAVHGRAGVLTAVEVATPHDASRRLPADILPAFFGLTADLGPIAGWGIALEHSRVPVDPATCQTGVPGIFAIGDVAHYPGKLKLILPGFSEAVMAAHAVFPVVRPNEALHFAYSTTTGVPRMSWA